MHIHEGLHEVIILVVSFFKSFLELNLLHLTMVVLIGYEVFNTLFTGLLYVHLYQQYPKQDNKKAAPTLF